MDLGRFAVIGVDLQNAFLHSDGSFARLGFDIRPLQESIPNAVRVLQAFAERGLPTFLTMLDYRSDYRNAGLLGSEIDPRLRQASALIEGTWDAALWGDLPQGAKVFRKHRYSAFYGTTVERALRRRQVEGVVVVGVTTSVCVESTVRDAMQRDFRVVVVSDATAEFLPERHEASLAVVRAVLGTVATTSEVLAALERLPGAVARRAGPQGSPGEPAPSALRRQDRAQEDSLPLGEKTKERRSALRYDRSTSREDGP